LTARCASLHDLNHGIRIMLPQFRGEGVQIADQLLLFPDAPAVPHGFGEHEVPPVSELHRPTPGPLGGAKLALLADSAKADRGSAGPGVGVGAVTQGSVKDGSFRREACCGRSAALNDHLAAEAGGDLAGLPQFLGEAFERQQGHGLSRP